MPPLGSTPSLTHRGLAEDSACAGWTRTVTECRTSSRPAPARRHAAAARRIRHHPTHPPDRGSIRPRPRPGRQGRTRRARPAAQHPARQERRACARSPRNARQPRARSARAADAPAGHSRTCDAGRRRSGRRILADLPGRRPCHDRRADASPRPPPAPAGVARAAGAAQRRSAGQLDGTHPARRPPDARRTSARSPRHRAWSRRVPRS